MRVLSWIAPDGRPRRLRIAVLSTLAIVTVMAVSGYAYIAGAGVRLSLANRSGADARDLRIWYSVPRGDPSKPDIELGSLPAGARFERRLGKIGDGAHFKAEWMSRGQRHHACWGIYFRGDGYDTVAIHLLPESRSEMVYLGTAYPPVACVAQYEGGFR